MIDGAHLGVEIAGRMDDGVDGWEASSVHDSGEAMSPAIGVAPHSPSFAAETPDRARAEDDRARALRVRAPPRKPIEPVPPRTRTRMISLPMEACPLNGHPEKSKRSSAEYCAATTPRKNRLKRTRIKKFLLKLICRRTPHRSALLLSRLGCDIIFASDLTADPSSSLETSKINNTRGRLAAKGSDAMKSAFHRSVLALATIVLLRG